MGDRLKFERFIWFHRRVRDGRFPNAKDLADRFEISSCLLLPLARGGWAGWFKGWTTEINLPNPSLVRRGMKIQGGSGNYLTQSESRKGLSSPPLGKGRQGGVMAVCR